MDSTISPTNRFDIIEFSHLSPEIEWQRLGAGSFGCVYQAQYLGLPVAVKEIFPRHDYNVEKYFARECKILQEARHPNIVQYIGLCLAPPGPSRPDHFHCDSDDEDDDAHSIIDHEKSEKPTQRILIISEYLPKGNLRSHILNHASSPALSWRLRLSFAIDITRAIAYLHERRCLHRDLKLENCLITDNFRIKLCDFGFARLEPKNDEERRRLSYCGTDGYMSPEILRGDPFGLATDVYSLGIVFCELITLKLTGQPNSSSTFLERLPPAYALKPADLKVLLRASTRGCPDGLIQLALKCSDVDSAQRPTVRTVLATLDLIERRVVAAEAEMLANAAKVEARAGPGAAKGLIDRLVKMDCVGSLSFGSGKMRSDRLPELPQPGDGNGMFETDRSSSGHPKRIPSFGGQVVVPPLKSKSSGSKEAQESEDSSSDEEDRPSVAQVACLLKHARHANPYHTALYHPPSSGASVLSVASTIRPHTILASSISSHAALERTSDQVPGTKSENEDSSTSITNIYTDIAHSSVTLVDPEPQKMSLGTGPSAGNRILQADTYVSTTPGQSGIPSNIGTIKTILSQSSSQTKCDTQTPSKGASKCPGLIATSVLKEAMEDATIDKHESIEVTSRMCDAGDASTTSNVADPPQLPTSIVTQEEGSGTLERLASQALKQEAVVASAAYNNEVAVPSKVNIEATPEPTIEALLAESNPIKNELGPHRFTLFKPNWLAYLFMKSPSSANSKDQLQKCTACGKKMGMRKSFLECDECGMKCHNKCSDSSGLPHCVLHPSTSSASIA
ncbi:hypothetical protein CROQUDRAFT_673211 [Cronartium quercuum f. sp. fusiforme G11]|uniref:TKL/LISK/LISK-DD1 protein kinase n=1 Tax=Cronartium quercuum f. sp. fusiforme G11 TaxID=708437 RepID=A0A9P6NBB4_9BASI|nr:hypothetical protein CROQUDRAFT_673211 [Cronartium quercuum f. sp. fusiforme G11]